ncbi:MAG: hypothetical protein NC213_10540 [Acetobacter sp.]|nr:hypothetical protein [Bacteroides sp.]MCM1342173.1 hypothetical protein [Acetobacter sp.]MCM1433148.1 hypothetical protein [Clostridiales bacterium]
MAKTDIKTVAKKNIKTLETVGIITEKVKDAGVKTKDDIGKAINTDSDTPEQYAAQRFQDTVHSTATDTAYYFNKKGKKSIIETKKNIENAQVTLEDIKARRAERKAKAKSAEQTNQNVVKTAETETKKQAEKIVKNAPKTASNDIRMGNNSAPKNKGKTIKTANDTFSKAKGVKTVNAPKNNIAVNHLAISKNAERSRKAAQYMKETAKEAAKLAKNSLKALIKAIKGAVKAAKSLVSAIIAGGWIAVIVIIVLCLVGALASSFYGIFFSAETSENGMNISGVIQEINADYDNRIDELKASDSYDSVEINGSKANWKDVLSIYAVKVTSDPDNPMEIATIDDNKKSILSNIFWDMNSIDSKTETRTETKETITTDEYGNEIISTDEITTKVLIISISSKTADEMAQAYCFDNKQKSYLAELMNDSNDKLWASIIFSTGNSNVDIDIGTLDFGDEVVNETQKKIVTVATNSSSYGISAKSGYCQAWVADVYQAVTGSRGSAHCALCAADMWAISTDWSKIPVGATVYGYSSSQYGHVGIYIGNGMVAHNIGYIKIEPIEDWIKTYKGFAWGWENNKNLV